jgi:hypothetical protein
MAELYSEGQKANKEIGKEIIRRLEVHNNYIPSSVTVRREYAYLLFKEYEEYLESRADKNKK